MLVISMSSQPILLVGITLIRNNGTAEIKCIHVLVHHHLRRIDIFQSCESVFWGKWFHQCSNLSGFILETCLDSLQLGRLDKRLIALDVDNHIIPLAYFSKGFVTTVSTTLVVYRGHHYLTTESLYGCFDTFVIGSHIRLIEHTRYLFIHSLNHWLSTQHGQWFSRETGRRISCWNNSNKFHSMFLFCFNFANVQNISYICREF